MLFPYNCPFIFTFSESLDDYELISYASDTDPNSMRGNSGEFLLSEPAQIIHDRISLTGSFEKMAAKLDILKILDVLDLDRNEPMKGGMESNLIQHL